jgi:hypothetical protein
MAKLYVEEEGGAGQNRFRAVVAGPGTKKQRQYSKFQTHLKTKKINHLFTAAPPSEQTLTMSKQTVI